MLQFEGMQREFTLIWGKFSLFVLFRPLVSWKRPTHTGRAACFTQSTNPNVHPTQKHLHRHAGITSDQISRFPTARLARHIVNHHNTPMSTSLSKALFSVLTRSNLTQTSEVVKYKKQKRRDYTFKGLIYFQASTRSTRCISKYRSNLKTLVHPLLSLVSLRKLGQSCSS